MYTICRKTASKRGGTSWIWKNGTELRQVGNLSKKAWLCCVCWDRKVIHPLGLSSTTPAANHLEAKHRLNSDGPIEDSTLSVAAQLQDGTNAANIEPIFTKQ